MSGEAEDFDLLAAIYVLGALEPSEAHSVEELAARDPEVARAVERWQERLAPLAAAVPPARPPADLWMRIAASIGSAPEAAPAADPQPSATVTPLRRAWRNVALWRATAAACALAAAVAGLALLSRPSPTEYAAALAPVGSPGAVFLAQVAPDGTLRLHPLATVPVPPGKDLELWALPEGAKAPVSLGVLPQIGRSVPASRVPQGPVQLLVSVEPAGGSPTGQPTGPVVYGAPLKRL